MPLTKAHSHRASTTRTRSCPLTRTRHNAFPTAALGEKKPDFRVSFFEDEHEHDDEYEEVFYTAAFALAGVGG